MGSGLGLDSIGCGGIIVMDEGVDTKTTSLDILHDLVNRIALPSS